MISSIRYISSVLYLGQPRHVVEEKSVGVEFIMEVLARCGEPCKRDRE